MTPGVPAFKVCGFTSDFKGTNVFHQTFQVYHIYFNFLLGYICRITIDFGTLIDGSRLINDKNNLQNGVDAMSKIDDAFLAER